MVPTVATGDSFIYLGRFFDFEMTNKTHKSKVVSIFFDLLKQIDCLPLYRENKLKLYSRHVLSKAAWHCIVADLSKTWSLKISISSSQNTSTYGLISLSALL